MKTTKRIIILALFFTISAPAISQNYKTGIGVRLGGLTSGITFRSFVNPSGAIEVLASFGHRSFILTGMYEKFRPISNAQGLQWFYGGGGHIGFFRYGGYYYHYKYKGNHFYVEEDGASTAVIGADFIIGMDYKFNNAPINIGLDLKPFIDFHDGGVYGYWDGAFSFRFVF